MRRYWWNAFYLCLGVVALSGCGQVAKPTPSVNVVSPEPAVATPFNLTNRSTNLNSNSGMEQEIHHPPHHRFVTPKSYIGPVPILMYHSIGINPKNTLLVPPAFFEEEMKHLKEHLFHTITFQDLKDWKQGHSLPDKPILITFDDGYKDNYTAAYPILKKYDLKATIFVVPGFVGGKNNLSWQEIEEMRHSGLIEFGAHTMSHLDLTQLSDAEQKYQLLESKQELESKLQLPVIAFAYPSGRYNESVLKNTELAGFEFAVTTHPGFAEQNQGMWTLRRVRVAGDESPAAFARQFP